MDDLKDFRVYVTPKKIVRADYRDGKSILLQGFKDAFLQDLPEEVIEELKDADAGNIDLELIEQNDFKGRIGYSCELTVGVALPERTYGVIDSETMVELTVPEEETAKLLRALQLPYRKAISGVLVYKKARENRKVAEAEKGLEETESPWEYIVVRDRQLHAFYAAIVKGNGKSV